MPPEPLSRSPASSSSGLHDGDNPCFNQYPDSKQAGSSSMRLEGAELVSNLSTLRTPFRSMSPCEARSSVLGRAFSRYDLDKSGTIDRNEMRLLLADLGWADDDDSINRIFCILDEENEGSLTYEQFMKWTEFAFASRILYRADMFPHSRNKSLSDEEVFSEQPGGVSFDNDCSTGRSLSHRSKSTLGIIVEEGGNAENNSDTLPSRPRGSGFGRYYGSRRCSTKRDGVGDQRAKISNPGSFARSASRKKCDRTQYLDLDHDIGNSSDEASNGSGENNQGVGGNEAPLSTSHLIAIERMKQRSRNGGSAKLRAKSVGFLCSDANARLNRAERMGVCRESRANSRLTDHVRWTVEQFLKSSDMAKTPRKQSSVAKEFSGWHDIETSCKDFKPVKNELTDRSVRFYDSTQPNDPNQDTGSYYASDEIDLRAIRTRKTK